MSPIELATGTVVPTPRTPADAAVPAVPAADVDDLRGRVHGPVYAAGDEGLAAEVATFNLAVQHTPAVAVGATLPEPLRGQTVVHLRYVYSGDDPAEGERLVEPMRAAGRIVLGFIGPLLPTGPGRRRPCPPPLAAHLRPTRTPTCRSRDVGPPAADRGLPGSGPCVSGSSVRSRSRGTTAAPWTSAAPSRGRC